MLVSHLPPSGWSDVVRTSDLDLHLRVIEARFTALDTKVDALDERVDKLDTKVDKLTADLHTQTWFLLGGAGALVGIVGGIAAWFT